jgi:hypothetical protein
MLRFGKGGWQRYLSANCTDDKKSISNEIFTTSPKQEKCLFSPLEILVNGKSFLKKTKSAKANIKDSNMNNEMMKICV